MKNRLGNIWKLSYLGIVAVAILQISWLVNGYISTKTEIQNVVNFILQESITKELDLRCISDLEKIPERTPLAIVSDSVENLSNSEVQLQESLSNYGSNISLRTVDSIFTDISGKLSLSVKVVICLVDNNDSIRESSYEHKYVSEKLKSNKFPVRIDSSLNVQAFIDDPYWVILKRMGLLLLSTIAMMIFVCWCIVCQIKVIIVERRIAQWKDTFSKAMIHDMKTPIAGIKLSAHILRTIKPEETKGRDEMLNYIERENEHLYALANKVLTIAKIEENKITLKKHEFELYPIIKDLMEKFQLRACKQVDFSLDINVKTAYGEEEYIKEAISNLVDNAIKYSGESVRIAITTKIEKEDMLCISVEDNGFGISNEDCNRIFEKFERGTDALKQGVSGFGLGLNYVKHAAEIHGGRADMMSRKGYGSIFIIMIPAKTNEKHEK
ncbi:sensor histidine kinase [Bacteroides sp. UBA939]|uniref:sensor histidine kinase n=1 Tax=Bacteroides sp. UBA939 TaxID=1946092 RepID=UPI0025BCEAFB|nr:HAMP domain-containing sensor histidine kinase [Bacteroides sp. UBA939]